MTQHVEPKCFKKVETVRRVTPRTELTFSFLWKRFAKFCKEERRIYTGYQRFFFSLATRSFVDPSSAEGRRHELRSREKKRVRVRVTFFKTWPKPETAHEKPLAPMKQHMQLAGGICSSNFCVSNLYLYQTPATCPNMHQNDNNNTNNNTINQEQLTIAQI